MKKINKKGVKNNNKKTTTSKIKLEINMKIRIKINIKCNKYVICNEFGDENQMQNKRLIITWRLWATIHLSSTHLFQTRSRGINFLSRYRHNLEPVHFSNLNYLNHLSSYL